MNYVHELVLNEKITNDVAAKTVDVERFFTISLFLSHISFSLRYVLRSSPDATETLRISQFPVKNILLMVWKKTHLFALKKQQTSLLDCHQKEQAFAADSLMLSSPYEKDRLGRFIYVCCFLQTSYFFL